MDAGHASQQAAFKLQAKTDGPQQLKYGGDSQKRAEVEVGHKGFFPPKKSPEVKERHKLVIRESTRASENTTHA